MTKIRFLVDYRGVLTKEKYFLAGRVVEDSEIHAAELVAEGRAEFVDHGPVIEPKPIIIHNRLDLEKLTIKQLRGLARDAKVPRWGKMSKAKLIAELRKTND